MSDCACRVERDPVNCDGKLRNHGPACFRIKTCPSCIEARELWRRLDDALVCGPQTTIDGKTAEEALATLVKWENGVALDPAVSVDAQKLRDTYLPELIEARKAKEWVEQEVKRLSDELKEARRLAGLVPELVAALDIARVEIAAAARALGIEVENDSE